MQNCPRPQESIAQWVSVEGLVLWQHHRKTQAGLYFTIHLLHICTYLVKPLSRQVGGQALVSM